MNFDAAALAYVRYVLEDKNLKPGALAKKAGISASTLTRALNDPKHKFKLSMSTLEKIADFSKINLAPFLEAKDTAELSLITAHSSTLYKPGNPKERSRTHAFKVTLIIGDVAVGVWRDAGPVNYFDYGSLHITSTIHEPNECFAFVARDASANIVADEGDLLFCTKPNDAMANTFLKAPGFEDLSGGAVIVERRSKNAFKIETTVRLIRRRRDGVPGWELLSAHDKDYETNTPKTKRPLIARVLLDHYLGNDEYRVVGEVQYVIKDNMAAVINFLQSVR
ncbi:hypothetical protein XI02_13770 [Bradyrhizobium sp. CCBAU 21365]|uniref:helix-turn-helix domain-containing protein n=1 Tax=Bradyrhizobium sp. CCBAU 21365 TaxID=1325083 RepID=UPI00188C5497|nr:helix-turn-helix transcriptional regulator [Bradyrhizobium sp. CCBAU 21365]QOZ15926.1 hypothetical protein XI02_13770 [Bradyrhizobium sp. CCBAU 21365]